MSREDEVAVQDIWLVREGGETGPATVVVYVQMDGVWYEAIRERAEASFSHNITAHGLRAREASGVCAVSWIDKALKASDP